MLARRRVLHLAAALALAASIGIVPLARVAACSCAGFTSVAEAVTSTIRDGQLVFIGTVMDSAPAGRDAMLGAQTIRYAFAVEAASEPTGPTVEVSAVGGDGGASCGIEFAAGERWAIATFAQGDAYTTNLCSANARIEDLAGADAAALRELLPSVPSAPPSASAGGIEVPGEIVLVAAAVGLVGVASAIAFRRRVS